MGLCQHVYRRGGVYWWRKRRPGLGNTAATYIHLSLKVREPRHAKLLGNRLSVEADRLAALIGSGMLKPEQDKALLQRFIEEQIIELDHQAIKATSKPLIGAAGKSYDAIDEHIKAERVLSEFYQALAVGGVTARITDRDRDRLTAEGFSEEDVKHVAYLVEKHAPDFSNFGDADTALESTTIGPPHSYFVDTLAALGFPITPSAIERSRRHWMRAKSRVLQDTERRYGYTNPEVDRLYEAALKARERPLDPSGDAKIVAPSSMLPRLDTKKPDEADSQSPAPSLRDLVAKLMVSKEKSGEWDENTAKQHKSVAELFIRFVETDDPRHITQSHVGGFRSFLDQLPRYYGKRDGDFSRPLGAILADAKKMDPSQVGRSPATINRILTQLGSILKFLRANGFEIADLTTIKDMRPRDRESGDRRLPFSAKELAQLFRHPVWSGCESAENRMSPGSRIIHDSLFWVPILGCYTLARLNELCGLLVDDVDINAHVPSIFIRGNQLRRIKTDTSSRRRIPIHPEIIRLGFAHYVADLKQHNQKMLFPDLRDRGEKSDLGSLFDKKWTKVLDAALPEARAQTKTFHSFRKTGNTVMMNNGVIDPLRHEILGHAQVGVNAKYYKAELKDEAKLNALSHLPVVTREVLLKS